jgi:hypothetical protein
MQLDLGLEDFGAMGLEALKRPASSDSIKE